MSRPIEHSRSDVLAAARRILHASATVRGLTMSTLAAELGTSKSSAYRHFNSRDDLIVAVVADAAATLEGATFNARGFGDLDAALANFLDDAPGALFETRGGKRDQIPAAARERLTFALAAITDAVETLAARNVPAALVPAVVVATVAAVSTPPTMLATTRAVALASAVALFDAVSN